MKNVFRFMVLLVFAISTSYSSYAQNSVGIGTTSPNPHAVLDLVSTDQGLLIPRSDTNTMISVIAPTLTAADDGLMMYASDINAFAYWDGDSLQWYLLNENMPSGPGASDDDWFISGDTVYAGRPYVVVGGSTPRLNSSFTSYKYNGIDNRFIAIVGESQNGVDFNVGVLGKGVGNAADTSIGVVGSADARNVGIGVRGEATIKDGTLIGKVALGGSFEGNVVGDNSAMGLNASASGGSGPVGITSGANVNGGHAIGIQSEGTGAPGDTTYGIFSMASGGTLNYAGYFGNGNVVVQDTLQVLGNPIGAGAILKDVDGSGKLVWASAGSGADTDWTEDASYIYSTAGKNIGIGTATPVRALQVAGDIGIGYGDAYYVGAYTGMWWNAGGGQIAYGSTGGQGMEFYAGSATPRMVVDDANGGVGIGTTAPDTTLHVVGSIKMEDGNQAAGYVMTSDATGIGYWAPATGVDADWTIVGSTMYNNTANSVVVGNSVGAAGIFTVDMDYVSTSNINPIATFKSRNSVSGASAGAVQIANSSGDYFNYGVTAAGNFAISNANNIGLTGDDLVIKNTTGFVGIGSINPGYLLEVGSVPTTSINFEVNGTSYMRTSQAFAAPAALTLVNENSSSTGVSLDLTSKVGATTTTRATVSGMGSGAGNAGGALVFKTKDQSGNNWPERMRIDHLGNVGIGTSVPDTTLHIVGNIKMVDGNEAAGMVMTSDGSGVGYWAPASGGADADWTIVDTNMYSAVSGNVGIGTSTPATESKLHVVVSPTGNNDNIRLESTTLNQGFGYMLQNPSQTWELGLNVGNFSDNRFQIFNISTSIPAITILTNNNVGIGATNPTQRLHVAGTETGAGRTLMYEENRDNANTSYVSFGQSSGTGANLVGGLMTTFAYSYGGLEAGYTEIANGGAGLIFRSNSGNSADIKFVTDVGDALMVEANGDVTVHRRLGVNTLGAFSPTADLDVVGRATIDTLNVNSAYTFPSADGSAGSTLVTNGAGSVSWQPAAPRWAFKVYQHKVVGGQNCTDGTRIDFNQVAFDDNAVFDLVGDQVEIPYDGVYTFSVAAATYNNGGAVGGFRIVSADHGFIAECGRTGGGATDGETVSTTVTRRLMVGDVVWIEAYGNFDLPNNLVGEQYVFFNAVMNYAD